MLINGGGSRKSGKNIGASRDLYILIYFMEYIRVHFVPEGRYDFT